jgi:hypothetical protein
MLVMILGLVYSNYRLNKATLIISRYYTTRVIFFIFYKVLYLFFYFYLYYINYPTLIELLKDV